MLGAQRPHQGVLNQIIGKLRIAGERAGIASKRRNCGGNCRSKTTPAALRSSNHSFPRAIIADVSLVLVRRSCGGAEPLTLTNTVGWGNIPVFSREFRQIAAPCQVCPHAITCAARCGIG